MSERDPLLANKMMRSARQIDEEQAIIDYGRGDAALDVVRDNKKRIMYIVVGLGVAAAVVACLVLGIMWAVDEGSDTDHPATPSPGPNAAYIKVQKAAIATENAQCSIIGQQIMKDKGGNAVDAAIASNLCVGVLHNFASGIGGGGVMLIRMNDSRSVMLDFREVAPAAAKVDMFVGKPGLSTVGGMAVAVPGELAGLEYAWLNYGSGNVEWQDLVEPSVELALNFTVGDLLAKRIASYLPAILNDTGLSSVYAPKGVALKAGEFASNVKLAETLQTVANEGARTFYDPSSALAQNLVKDIQAKGGIITLEDLSSYYHNFTVKVREPVSSFYQGYEVISSAPPFGGLCVLQALNLLELYNLPLMGQNEETYHLLAEALNFAFADRMALGDPAFVNLTKAIPAMMGKEHASRLRSKIKLNATFPYQYYEDLVNFTAPIEDAGTTHLSVIDSQRNAVSLTSTVNLVFGAKFLSTSTGVVLNNQMDDFSTPNTSNAFNLPPSEANFIVPGKRPLSSMSPTIVTKNGQVYLVVGASGGSRIITSTLQALLGVVAYKQDVWKAVSSPRLHNQLLPPFVYTEAAFSPAITAYLKKIGHDMAFMEEVGVVAAVQLGDDGYLYAASDPRKLGRPAGF